MNSDRSALMSLIALNMLPLYGVLAWDFSTFDLIFIYWMENVVLGAITILRMLVRPYGHPIELVYPILLAPFFAFHYGFFCEIHGSFVVSIFSDQPTGASALSLLVDRVLTDLETLYAFAALAGVQLIIWLRDIRSQGLGMDGVKDLMTRPYRRIFVLHLTIIVSGFALMALGSPQIGLIALVAIKTGSDLWHWRQETQPDDEQFKFDPEMLEEVRNRYPEPVVKINGKAKHFDSFASLKKSRELQLAQAIIRFLGASEELKALNAYFDMKIANEKAGQSSSSIA
jgi:hypothetical protein